MAAPALSSALRYVRRTAESAETRSLSDRQLLERYRARRDEAAFAVLVRRHRLMVYSAIRHVLTEPADIDDAFQATFLVLIHKAAVVRWQPSIGNWLYAVAHRVAVRARARAVRRKKMERDTGERTRQAAPADMTWREAVDVLHEELDRLPDRFRVPLLLCYLDGQSRDEAAAQLGCSMSTLKGRLETGRKRLRTRLTRRGVELSASLLAVVIADASRALSPSLVRHTVQLAGGAAPSAAVAALASSAAGWTAGHTKLAAGLLLAAGVISGAVAGLSEAGPGSMPSAQVAAAPAAEPPRDNSPAKPVEPTDGESVALAGRVLGPDGKPVAGAKLFICHSAGKHSAPQASADADGRFRFIVGPPPDGNPDRYLLAMADGLGLDWAEITAEAGRDDLTLRLPMDVPIRGRVVDLEGRPVADATVALEVLNTTASDNLDEFFEVWGGNKDNGSRAVGLVLRKHLHAPYALNQVATVRSAADGTFVMSGIGRDRAPLLRVSGRGVSVQLVRVLLRPGLQPSSRPVGVEQYSVSAPDLTVVVAPSKPFSGVVRDAQTGQPIAGVTVAGQTVAQMADRARGSSPPVEAVTDADGRYRLEGLAKVPNRLLAFVPPAGTPYVRRFVDVADTEGFQPLTADTELFRGVIISGRLTDKATGRPALGSVRYDALAINDLARNTPGYLHPLIVSFSTTWMPEIDSTITDGQGRYRMTVLPGAGLLLVRAQGQFIDLKVADADRDPEVFDTRTADRSDVGGHFKVASGRFLLSLKYFTTYRVIRPAADAGSLSADFALDGGLSRTGRVVDPAGEPLAGVFVHGLRPGAGAQVALPEATFTATCLDPEQPRRLIFRHVERNLAVTVSLRGNEPDPMSVKLQPAATLLGRALKADGEPLAGARVSLYGYPPLAKTARGEFSPILTDADGRFRIEAIPGGTIAQLVLSPSGSPIVSHRLDNVTVQPGETKDLGDIPLRKR